jgi:dTDP-4-dehydrorhamnose reductase
MTRIVILGSTGMLGHKVFEHFSNLEGYEVFGSYRNKSVAPAKNSFAFDAESPDWSKIPECDYVLNCIGVIKPFMKDNTIGAIKSLHDCLDDYGKSKSLGEPTNCMVIRTSIIGEEIHKNASLIAWAKTQKGKSVNGFLNHDWNGVTTLEYAKVCQQVIDKGLYEIGLHHVHSPQSVNKFELLQIISDVVIGHYHLARN